MLIPSAKVGGSLDSPFLSVTHLKEATSTDDYFRHHLEGWALLTVVPGKDSCVYIMYKEETREISREEFENRTN